MKTPNQGYLLFLARVREPIKFKNTIHNYNLKLLKINTI